MAALRIRPEIVTEACLEIEPGRDGAAPERLHFGFFRFLAEAALAFALYPKLVDVAAIPALRVPEIAIPAIVDTGFELVDHHSVRPHRALFGTKLLARLGHGRRVEQRVGGMSRTGQRGRRRRSFGRSEEHTSELQSLMRN